MYLKVFSEVVQVLQKITLSLLPWRGKRISALGGETEREGNVHSCVSVCDGSEPWLSVNTSLPSGPSSPTSISNLHYVWNLDFGVFQVHLLWAKHPVFCWLGEARELCTGWEETWQSTCSQYRLSNKLLTVSPTLHSLQTPFSVFGVSYSWVFLELHGH